MGTPISPPGTPVADRRAERYRDRSTPIPASFGDLSSIDQHVDDGDLSIDQHVDDGDAWDMPPPSGSLGPGPGPGPMGGAGAAAGAGVGGAGANGTGAGVGADSSRPSAFASANVGPDMYEALRAAGIPLTDDEIDRQTRAMARISSGGSPSPSGLRTPTGNVRLDSPPAREHGAYCSTIDLDSVTSSLSARRKDYVVDIRRSAGKIVIEGVVESRFLRLVAMPREGINTCVRRRSSGGRTKTTISFVEGVMTSDQQEQMLEGMRDRKSVV